MGYDWDDNDKHILNLGVAVAQPPPVCDGVDPIKWTPPIWSDDLLRQWKNAWCMINKWSLSQHLTPDVQHITVWCPDVYLGSNYEGIRSNLQTLAEQNGSSQHFFWICCDSQCIQDSRFLDMKDIERHRLDVSRPWHRLHLPSGYD